MWGVTNGLGFLFSQFVTFIVNGRVTFLGPTAWHIRWMVLRLVTPPLQISNAMLVYSSCTKKYYQPDSYRLDPYRLPSLVYPDLRYDGGLFCSLVCDGSAPMEELYPSCTRVEQINPTARSLVAGTVMDILISTDVSG